MKQVVFRLAFLALLVLGSPTHAQNFVKFTLPTGRSAVNQFVQPFVAGLELMISPAVAKMRDVFVYELYEGDTPNVDLSVHRFDSNNSYDVVYQIGEALPAVPDPREYPLTNLYSGKLTFPHDDQRNDEMFPPSATPASVIQIRKDFKLDVCREADYLTCNRPINVSVTGLDCSEVDLFPHGADDQLIFEAFTERLLVRLLIVAAIIIWTTDLYFILPAIWKKGICLLQSLGLIKKRQFPFLPDPSCAPLPPMNVLMNPRKNILPASGMLQVLWSPEITETEKETIVLKHMKKNLVKRRWKQASAMRHVVEFVKGKEWTESHMKKIKKGDKETHNKLVHSAGQNDAEVGATNVENENIENDSNVDGEVEV